MNSIKESPELTLRILEEYTKKDIKSTFELGKLIPEYDEETLSYHLAICINSEFIDGTILEIPSYGNTDPFISFSDIKGITKKGYEVVHPPTKKPTKSLWGVAPKLDNKG